MCRPPVWYNRGSRVRHRLLFAGPADSIAEFRHWLEREIVAGEHLHDVRDARPEFRAALERAEQFLGLAALVSVLLSGVAIAMAARRFAERHLDSAAVFRCLGAQQRDITSIFCFQVLALGLLASTVGCGVGFVAQWGLAALLGSLMLGELPPPAWTPALIGLLGGLVTVIGFGLTPADATQGCSPRPGPAPRSRRCADANRGRLSGGRWGLWRPAALAG